MGEQPREWRNACLGGERGQSFARRVVTYGWHLARAHGSIARVALGMTPMHAIQTTTKNAAEAIHMGRHLGTLEAGKLADIILLEGNPLEGYWNFLNTKVVVKGGIVVVDKR